MIKSLDNDSNMYLRTERIPNVSVMFRTLTRQGKFISSNVTDPSKIFNELHDFSMKHKSSKRTCRRDIEAISLEVMIPQNLTEKQVLDFSKEYAVKAFHSLPYSAYLIKKGNGLYIHYLISERRYLKKSETIQVTARSDFYQKINESGKKVIAKATDEGAICIHKKGTVYSTYSSHFTNKDRMFTGNDNEFTHKIRNLKQIALSLLAKMNFVIKRVFFKKIHIKESKGNYYHYMNIRDLNDTFMYFENRLNEAENLLLLGYMEDELPLLNKIKYRYLNRARNMRFHYGRVSLPFYYKMQRDIFRNNLDTFVDSFNSEIINFHKELSQI